MRHVLQFDLRVAFKSRNPDVPTICAITILICAPLRLQIAVSFGGLMMPREQGTKTQRKDGFHNAHAQRAACTSRREAAVYKCVYMHP